VYVITFYSFRGGVGRSMAMVNVGAELARAGKKVLLVDFDLEAPSLTTFNLKAADTCSLGIVDYVSEYLKTDCAPNVRDYVSDPEHFASGGVLWIMPAGAPTNAYQERLTDINWVELYERRSGYLLLEELKAQLQAQFNPDYVLIDSRTGHSDVSGICTRQLPNAVCFMFAPNRQSLDGLASTVQLVRAANADEAAHPIELFFVESAVPYHDDERRTLAKNRNLFLERLNIPAFSATLHQYPHLSLLDRSVFVQEFPETSLAQEYRHLADTLRRENLADRDAVLPRLKRIVSQLQTSWGSTAFGEDQRKLDDIARLHGNDPEVCFWLGRISRYLGDVDQALIQLNQAVLNGYRGPEAFLERAGIELREGTASRVAEAVDDLRTALRVLVEKPRYSDVLYAIRTLISIAPSSIEECAASEALRALSAEEQVAFAYEISTSDRAISMAYAVLRHVRENKELSAATMSNWRNVFALVCINQKKFSEAVEALSDGERLPRSEQSRLFNLGVARWAQDAVPPTSEFGKVIELDKEHTHMHRDPNHFQCIAISYCVVGDREHAIAALERARRVAEQTPRLHFSAWTFCKVPPAEFVSHCAEMKKQILENRPLEFPAIQPQEQDTSVRH
jgi:MinD-like ATPase involved in chromosome partitioning or flagellar assembly